MEDNWKPDFTQENPYAEMPDSYAKTVGETFVPTESNPQSPVQIAASQGQVTSQQGLLGTSSRPVMSESISVQTSTQSQVQPSTADTFKPDFTKKDPYEGMPIGYIEKVKDSFVPTYTNPTPPSMPGITWIKPSEPEMAKLKSIDNLSAYKSIDGSYKVSDLSKAYGAGKESDIKLLFGDDVVKQAREYKEQSEIKKSSSNSDVVGEGASLKELRKAYPGLSDKTLIHIQSGKIPPPKNQGPAGFWNVATEAYYNPFKYDILPDGSQSHLNPLINIIKNPLGASSWAVKYFANQNESFKDKLLDTGAEFAKITGVTTLLTNISNRDLIRSDAQTTKIDSYGLVSTPVSGKLETKSLNLSAGERVSGSLSGAAVLASTALGGYGLIKSLATKSATAVTPKNYVNPLDQTGSGINVLRNTTKNVPVQLDGGIVKVSTGGLVEPIGNRLAGSGISFERTVTPSTARAFILEIPGTGESFALGKSITFARASEPSFVSRGISFEKPVVIGRAGAESGNKLSGISFERASSYNPFTSQTINPKLGSVVSKPGNVWRSSYTGYNSPGFSVLEPVQVVSIPTQAFSLRSVLNTPVSVKSVAPVATRSMIAIPVMSAGFAVPASSIATLGASLSSPVINSQYMLSQSHAKSSLPYSHAVKNTVVNKYQVNQSSQTPVRSEKQDVKISVKPVEQVNQIQKTEQTVNKEQTEQSQQKNKKQTDTQENVPVMVKGLTPKQIDHIKERYNITNPAYKIEQIRDEYRINNPERYYTPDYIPEEIPIKTTPRFPLPIIPSLPRAGGGVNSGGSGGGSAHAIRKGYRGIISRIPKTVIYMPTINTDYLLSSEMKKAKKVRIGTSELESESDVITTMAGNRKVFTVAKATSLKAGATEAALQQSQYRGSRRLLQHDIGVKV